MIIFAMILLGTESNVIPRQLLHSLRAPFFGILTILPLFQLDGISSYARENRLEYPRVNKVLVLVLVLN